MYSYIYIYTCIQEPDSLSVKWIFETGKQKPAQPAEPPTQLFGIIIVLSNML